MLAPELLPSPERKLSYYDFKKVASTFRFLRDCLETDDPTDRFMLLVKA